MKILSGVKRKLAVLAIALALAPAALWAEESAADTEKAKANFESSYKAAVDSMTQNDWETAEVLFDAALKALGAAEHTNKTAAETLLAKAKRLNAAKRETAVALKTAEEFVRLKQWKEAEAQYRKALASEPNNAEAKKGLAGIQAEVKEDDYRAAFAEGQVSLEQKNWDGAEKAFTRALEVRPKDAAAEAGLKEARAGKPTVAKAPAPAPAAKPEKAAPLELPTPVTLSQDDWTKGAGSTCMWAAELLHLNEGDEKYKQVLKGDFAVSVGIEHEAGQHALIYVDLRPDRDSGKKDPILHGYGSRMGTPPVLLSGSIEVARGKQPPARQQITLSFRRTGGQVEFFMDNQKIGESWDIHAETPVWLWVCGKGILNGVKVVGGK